MAVVDEAGCDFDAVVNENRHGARDVVGAAGVFDCFENAQRELSEGGVGGVFIAHLHDSGASSDCQFNRLCHRASCLFAHSGVGDEVQGPVDAA